MNIWSWLERDLIIQHADTVKIQDQRNSLVAKGTDTHTHKERERESARERDGETERQRDRESKWKREREKCSSCVLYNFTQIHTCVQVI